MISASLVSRRFLLAKYSAHQQHRELLWLEITKLTTLSACFSSVLVNRTSALDNHVLACNFAKYSPILNFFTLRLSNKRFLICLLTAPPHIKCVATLPCNLSLIAFLLLTLMFHEIVTVEFLISV